MAKEVIKHFDSPEQYLDFLQGVVPARCYADDSTYDREFYGARDKRHAWDMLRDGDKTNLAAAENLIAKMREQQIFSEKLPIMERSVVGYIPNVPAALANHPKAMFVRAPSEYENTSTPLKVYIETLVSGGVGDKELVARGVALLGFVLAMNMIRPIELYAVSVGCHGGITSGVVVKIPTKPLDLMRATFMLTHKAYYRRLAFAAIFHMGGHSHSGSLNWAFNSSPMAPDYVEKMKELVGASDDDVYMKGGYLFDQVMLKDPVKWVKDMVAQHNKAKEC